MKHCIADAIAALESSLGSIPHELNELDWKHSLSPKKDRLTQHLSAFANYPNGGVLVFGIDDQTGVFRGITPAESESIIGQLANLGREAVDPPVSIGHAVTDIRGVALLLVLIKESKVKPVHLRGKPLDNCFIRSGGSTRKASRQEVGALMLNSSSPRWEELRATILLRPGTVLRYRDRFTAA